MSACRNACISVALDDDGINQLYAILQWRLCEIGLEDYSFVLLSRYVQYFTSGFLFLSPVLVVFVLAKPSLRTEECYFFFSKSFPVNKYISSHPTHA